MTPSDFDFVVIDAGNSRIKIAFWLRDQLVDCQYFSNQALRSSWAEVSKSFHHIDCIVSSVLSDEQTDLLLQPLKSAKRIFASDIFFENDYKTFETLGADRKANAVFLQHQKKYPALSIDIGTCVKFDFIDENGVYLGGSIAPGLNMRFKSLHHFTGKLPEVTFEAKTSLIGNSTKNSMLSGVVFGMESEINGLIERYSSLFPEISIFITGGDADKFNIQKENCIFAKFLTLEGLYLINKLNA